MAKFKAPPTLHPLTGATCMNKTDKLKSALAKDTANYAIFNSTNITYFTSFSGAAALLIPKDGPNTLYVSAVNFEQAKAEVKGFQVELLKRGENLLEKIVKQANPQANAKLAVDSLSVESWRALAKAAGGEQNLQTASSVILDLRAAKDPNEIELIRQACKLADLGISAAYQTIQSGISELEVAAEVEYAMRKSGSCGTSFDTIIASGANSAFPHGSCTNRTIQNGDLVVVDLGATVGNYRSDITRTITAGKPTIKQQKIYSTVKTVQDLALNAIKPNVQAKEVDAVAREAIKQAGFGECFMHNLGHGVGLEIHEAPVLSPESKDVLAAGNVVTVEPGIYIVGFGGVRIEDTVLVTESGAEKLTHAKYTLTAHR
jgi:Xaa-Pro aminopeptidase